MLKSIVIKNFQSHKDTTLEFDSGVNVIVGPSDSGKTAILRALKWLVWNRPTGDEFRSDWGGDTTVSVNLSERLLLSVTREKTNRINCYELDTDELKEPQVFEAIKTEVPKEISSLLDINEINLQSQLDQPFLLSKSPGEVAQHFNKIAKLDKIDIGLQNVNKSIRELGQDISYKKDYLTKLNEQLKQFAHLSKFEAEVEVLESLEKRLVTLVNNEKRLHELRTAIDKINFRIAQEQDILKIEPCLTQILKRSEDKSTLVVQCAHLEKICLQIKENRAEMARLQKLLPIGVIVDKLTVLFNDKELLESDRADLLLLKSNVLRVEHQVETAKMLYDNLNDEFKTSFPDVCPLCGQPITKTQMRCPNL